MVDDPVEAAPERPARGPESHSPTDRLIAKTPWWTMSTGIHVIATLILAYLIVLSGPEVDARVTEFAVHRKRPPPVVIERPKDLDPNKKILDLPKSVPDPVFIKDATEANHTETPDDEDFQKAKGDPDFVSDKPFKGKGIGDTIGAGQNGGGNYGQRGPGGRLKLVKRGGGGSDTEDAVLAALKWLARHQNDDGSWNAQNYVARCNRIANYASGGKCAPNPGHEDFDPGVTGLALLAFLGAGYTHMSRDTHDGICFGDVVKRALQWIMAHQDPEGCIGPRTAHKYMYNHAICALALCEAYGITGSALFREQAQRAVDFCVASQNPGKGWRYSAKCGDNDSSVTGWAIMALKSAEAGGLSFPRTSYDGTRAWYDEVTEEDYYRVGYTHRGTGKVFEPGANEQFNHHEALTAIAVMARIFIDRRQDPRLTGGCQLLVKDVPAWKDNDIDFYYWYYASLALFQYDGPTGPFWKQWNERMKDALVKNQNTPSTGCKYGSWEPVDRWSHSGGRVYGTAINALTLEVYYRYPNVFNPK